MRSCALAVRAQRAQAVGIVHQNPGLVLLGQLQQTRQIDNIAIHAKHPIGNDELVRAAAGLQLALQRGVIGMRVTPHLALRLRPRQERTVYQAGVV